MYCLTLFITTVHAGFNLQPPTLETVVLYLAIFSAAALRSEKGFGASHTNTQTVQKAPLKPADYLNIQI